ncbi:MAG: hypothetical protein J6113_00675 [Lachnospiraceae bacterium]|nr:hypothetical protein [Lachnospiraceae bacterium]
MKGKQVNILIALLCVLMALTACNKGNTGKPATLTPGADPTQSVTKGAEPSPTATATPTPTQLPYLSYEKASDKGVYKVPADAFPKDSFISTCNTAGDYALIQLWVTSTDPEGEMYSGSLGFMLLRPGISGEAVKFTPGYFVSESAVLADGTVFLQDSYEKKVYVYDNTFTELYQILTGDCGLLEVTGEGDIWLSDEAESKLIVLDRTGKEKTVIDIKGLGVPAVDLGVKDGKRYFDLRFDEESQAPVLICVDEKTGEAVNTGVQVIDVLKGEEAKVYYKSLNMLQHTARQTWFLYDLAGSGHWISFPYCYLAESLNGYDGKRLFVSGDLPGVETEDDLYAAHACRVYDIESRTVLGELTASDLPSYARYQYKALMEDGTVLLSGFDEENNEELLLWDIGACEPSPVPCFFDLDEKGAEETLEALRVYYREKYGIVYETVPLKTLSQNPAIMVLKNIDVLNVLASGVASNPEEFKKDADGIAIRLENIFGHEHGNIEFKPHLFPPLYKKLYGERKQEDFFRFVDAARSGEATFECTEDSYGWVLGRFAMYYYPAATGCITSAYDSRNLASWNGGRGTVPYYLPVDESLKVLADFEQLVCDIINDSVSDDYTDFEKALALYEYITLNWRYDYDLYEHIYDPDWDDVGSIYRCMKDRLGICWEIAGVYDYLLSQCGVEAHESSGYSPETDENHAWSYVKIDGKAYNTDATWGLTVGGMADLSYFLFTDSMRENRDGYPFKGTMLIGTDEMLREKNGFKADDERFAPLWGGYYIGMDRTAKKVLYYKDGKMQSFYYGD